MLKTIDLNGWQQQLEPQIQGEAIQALEAGQIILFPQLSFAFKPDEQRFLSTAYSTHNAKNISYNIHTRTCRGLKSGHADKAVIAGLMHRYVEYTSRLFQQLFPSYTSALEVGRTSFRPIEIKGRTPKSVRKDDTRLHVDAFPSSPLQGKRIIRIFSNVNPHGTPRVWRIGEPFEKVASHFLPTLKPAWWGRGRVLKALKFTRGYATDYDYAMLQLHNKMKADQGYQKGVAAQEFQFLPGSTWIVQTDQVSHAVLSGQYLMEQTFYLPVEAMYAPNQSPLKILERLTGRQLV